MTLDQTITVNNATVSVKISGQGKKCIFFLHGSSMSAETWMPQLTNAGLQKEFKLIAIDIPGHGNSEWLNERDRYGLKELADVVKQVTEVFQPGEFMLVGLSLGTNIIGEITPPLNNCTGIMLVSSCILNDQFPPNVVITPGSMGHVIAAENPTDSDLREYIYSQTKNTALAERCINDYRKTDPAFRQALGHITMNAGWTDELVNIQKWNIPVCVVFGKEDTLIKTSYLDNYPALWNGKVHHIEGAGHILNEENPEFFNKLLKDFAWAVFK